MRVILSRKGFDMNPKYGGVPSPIFPDGEMLSLPILYDHSPTVLDEVMWNQTTIGAVVESLTGKKIEGSRRCHLDPDLRYDSRPRRNGWLPAFGQVGNSQSHLRNNGVSEGDLFLFFGAFRPVRRTDNGWRYRHDLPKIHAVFGWLQVGNVVRPHDGRRVREDYPWLCDHAHMNDLEKWQENNVIYQQFPACG